MPNRRLTMPGHKTPVTGFCVRSLLSLLVFMLIGLVPLRSWADWSPLIDRLVRDGNDNKIVAEIFARPEARFDPDPMSRKIETLIRQQFQEPSADQEARIRALYNKFLRPELIERALAYTHENKATLKSIRTRYCVPEEIVVAILLVETELGRNTGSRMAFNTLASMALAGDLEMIRPYLASDLLTASNEDYARRRCREKSDWAYQELLSLIHYALENKIDPLEIPGSIYGAIGLCQFMPSNISSYGVDADGDGRIDLFVTEDALHSMGKYLHRHGWKCNMSRKSRYRVIMAYNRSPIYANTVLDIAKKLRIKLRDERPTAGQPDRS
ncbi:MAG: lytic murein transglycosylase [Pseudomonadota bacterium]